jgi:hypothetical protein
LAEWDQGWVDKSTKTAYEKFRLDP